MNIENLQSRLSSLATRIKDLALTPKECWDVIANEDAPPEKILSEKIVPLVALGAVCAIVGYQVFGISMGPLGTWRPPLLSFTVSTLVMGVLEIVKLYVAAWIALKLATFFQGSTTQPKAFSLVAHSMLPALAGGLLSIFPPLGLLGIVLLLVSIRAFYLGIPKMTTVPDGQRLGYAASFVVSMMLVSIVLGLATAMFIAAPQPGL